MVKQTETRALKTAAGSKSSQFLREIDGIYTESTLIADEIRIDGREIIVGRRNRALTFQ